MSEFDSFIVKPETITEHDTIGVYALPINANPGNTGDRLTALANKVGFPLVAIDYLNQGRTETHNMPAKQANAPSGRIFTEMSELRALFTAEQLKPFSDASVIGIGDSLGVPTMQGVTLANTQLFDAVLLRDGWNLGKATSAIRGIGRYGLYQIKDAINNMRNPRQFDTPPTDFSQSPQEWSNETGLAAKLWNVADIMRGGEARQNTVALASIASLTMHVVLFGHGLSGNAEQSERFKQELLTAREAAMLRKGEGARLAVTTEHHA